MQGNETQNAPSTTSTTPAIKDNVEKLTDSADKIKDSTDRFTACADKIRDNSDEKKAKSKKLRSSPNKKTVLFVCTGNTCRSPMAERIFAQFLRNNKQNGLYKVASAGLATNKFDQISPNAKTALSVLKIRQKKHIVTQLTAKNASKADVIICMSYAHKERILEGCDHKHIYSFSEVTGASDVPDPYGCGVDRYISCAKYFIYACEDILDLLKKLDQNQ